MKVKMKMRKTAIAVTAIVVLAAAAYAEAPNLFTYQGRLKEGGQAVSGNRTVEIQLCPVETGGSCETTGAQPVAVSNGLFRSTFTIPAAVNFGTGSWWLEIKVGADTLAPRERLTSNAYSLFSATAAYAENIAAAAGSDGVYVSSNLYVTGALGAARLLLSAGVLISSETDAGLGAGINISSNVYVVGFSSAARYYGDGSALTGVTATGISDASVTDAKIVGMSSSKLIGALPAISGALLTDLPVSGGAVAKAGDTMTGQLTLSGSTLTVSGDAFSVGGSTLTVSYGRVGIGTTTPGYPLSLNPPGSNIASQIGLYQNGVLGATISGGTAAPGISLVTGADVGGAAVWTHRDTNPHGRAQVYLDDFIYSYSPAGTVGAPVTWQERFRIDGPTGMVGIGVAAPGSALDVAGDINASGNLCINGDCKNSWSAAGDSLGSHTATQALNMADNQIKNVSSLTVIGSAFSVGGSTLVVANGSVGVGNSAPQGLFQVGAGTLTVLNDGTILIGRSGPVDAKVNIAGRWPGVDKEQPWYNSALGLLNTDITNNNLHAIIFTSSNTSGGENTTGAIASVVTGHTDPAGVNSDMYFGTAQNSVYSTKVVIKNSGEVGIGSASPGYKLDVQGGSINASGGLCINGNCIGGWPVADSLGSHTATQYLDLAQYPAVNVSSLAMVGDGLRISTSVYAGSNGIFVSNTGQIMTIGPGTGTALPNARGTGAVDLQVYRADGTDVASGNYSVITGGWYNSAGGATSMVAGGVSNSAGGNYSTVAGGQSNTAAGAHAVITGGLTNSASGVHSAVGGGTQNDAVSDDSVVSGGYDNSASGYAASITGGVFNMTNAYGAAVLGGANAYAAGQYSAVIAGNNNTAKGDYSFAAGRKSSSTASGAFTWADSQGALMENAVADRTLFKNRGGFLITGSTSTVDPAFFVDGTGKIGLGTLAPVYKLDLRETAGALGKGISVSHSGAVAGPGYAAYISKSGASTNSYGLYAEASGGVADNYGVVGLASGNLSRGGDFYGDNYGAVGTANCTTGICYGGYFSTPAGGTGTRYGVYSILSAGADTNIGVYASASGATNNYAAIFENGNVGIGVTGPVEKLEVSGGIKVGNSAGSSAGTIRYNGGAFEGYNGAAWVTLNGSYSVDISTSLWGLNEGVTPNTVYTVGASSNVAIGTMDAGVSKLRITGADNTSAANAILAESLDSTQLFRVRNDGKMAVGPQNPAARLDIQSAALDSYAQIWRNSAGIEIASISAAGYFKAVKLIGEGSAITNLSAAALPQQITVASITAVGGAAYDGVVFSTAIYNSSKFYIGPVSDPISDPYSVPTADLHVRGLTRLDQRGGESVVLLFHPNFAGDAYIRWYDPSLVGAGGADQGTLGIRAGERDLVYRGGATDLGNGVETFRAKPDGSFIVGSAGASFTPSARFHVINDLAVSAAGLPPALFVSTASSYVGISTGIPAEGLHVASSLLVGADRTSSVLYVSTQNGFVGIGTGNPQSKLAVSGGDIHLVTGGLRFPDNTVMTSANVGVAVGSLSNNSDAIVQSDADLTGGGNVILRAGSLDGLVLDNSGNVGIGAVNPVSKLNVRGGDVVLGTPVNPYAANGVEDLIVGGNIAFDGALVQRSALPAQLSGLVVASDVYLSTTTGTKTRIGSDVAPVYTLDIAGDINASGSVRTGGTVRISNTGTIGIGNANATWDGATIPVSRGGTGATTLTGVIHGNGTGAFTAGSVDLASEISGTLPVANGGTGLTGGVAGKVMCWKTASSLGYCSDAPTAAGCTCN